MILMITAKERERQAELEKRLVAEKGRIRSQRKAGLKRVEDALNRAEKRLVPSPEQDKMENAELINRSAKLMLQSSRWDGIWSNRQAKWDARKRRLSG